MRLLWPNPGFIKGFSITYRGLCQPDNAKRLSCYARRFIQKHPRKHGASVGDNSNSPNALPYLHRFIRLFSAVYKRNE